MDSTLHDLGNLLIASIPTIFFFIFLIFFLQRVYFRPIAQVLEERRRATEGVRDLARQALAAADSKTSEFERALQLARNEIGQENEAQRRHWEQEHTELLAKARAEADARIQRAKGDIAVEVESAKQQLGAQVDALSEQIVRALGRRRAA